MKMTKIMAVVMSVVMLLAVTVFSASAANNVNLTTLTPGFNNLNMEATGADGLGVTLSGPWTTNDAWAYTYWNITWDQIQQTPYIVVDIAEDTLPLFGGWCDLSIGYVNQAVYSFRDLGAVKQVVDMRTLIPEGSNDLCLCFTTEASDPLVFEALYLTDDANGGGNNDTGVESAVAVAAAAVIGAASLMVISRKK